MTIERTAESIIVTLPASFDITEIQRFLDYLRFKEIVSKFDTLNLILPSTLPIFYKITMLDKENYQKHLHELTEAQ